MVIISLDNDIQVRKLFCAVISIRTRENKLPHHDVVRLVPSLRVALATWCFTSAGNCHAAFLVFTFLVHRSAQSAYVFPHVGSEACFIVFTRPRYVNDNIFSVLTW